MVLRASAQCCTKSHQSMHPQVCTRKRAPLLGAP